MFIKQISAFVENRPGRIAEITEILASHNIDLRALSVADTTDFGILRIIVDRPDEVTALLRENRVTVTGALEENGFDHVEIKLNELVAEISPGAAIIVGNLKPVTFYGYTDESKTPVKHNSNLVHSQELYKLLRGE